MLQRNFKKIVIVFGFLIFALILAITKCESLFWNAIALGFLMIYFWIFEVIPIYLTALFPIILSAPLGLLEVDGKVDSSVLAKSYGNNMIFIFLGGFMLALALEKWKIHLQIAKGILRIVGNSKPRIILGFLLSTSVLSMWVSNTATALMILPMGIAVIKSLPTEEKNSRFSLFLLLAIAYGSNIGGIGTLVGSPPNLQMASILSKQFDVEVSFSSWFVIGFPICVLMILFTFLYFYFALGKSRKDKIESFSLEKESWTKNQYKVLAVFLFFVFMWSFKDLFALIGFHYSDEMVAIFGTVLLFLVPSDNKMNLLEWSDTKTLPWGILLLFGGGLALAQALTKGGVIKWLADSFQDLNNLPYFILLLILVTIAIFATEIMSNLALVTVLIPVIASFAGENNYSIIQICFSVTLASSFAFMLPIGTPPNAIVFSAGHITIKQMAKVGFLLNIIGVLLITLVAYLFL
jgi:solute carrier family 13 (sodium-dependent dicarboxylate transporter), member 2/3/5